MIKKIIYFALIFLAGCSEKKIPLKGDRVSVLVDKELLKEDKTLKNISISLPVGLTPKTWPTLQMNNLNNIPPLKESSRQTIRWKKLPYDCRPYIHHPFLLADQYNIYLLSRKGHIYTIDQMTGKEKIFKHESTDGLYHGGIVVSEKNIYLATDDGYVKALSKTGQKIWQKRLSAPIHAVPKLYHTHLFVITVDNSLYCLDAVTGEIRWEYKALDEPTGLLGAAGVAVASNIVIAPFSSGEIVALDTETGKTLWQDNLSSLRKSDIVSTLSTIQAMPVISESYVYTISHNGKLMVHDYRNGIKIWEHENVSSIQTPLIMDKFILIHTLDNHLICFNKYIGGIKWVKSLSSLAYTTDKWSQPIIVNNLIIMYNTVGEKFAFAPENGALIKREKTIDRFSTFPIYTQNGTYQIADSGTLYAYK